MFVAFLQLKQFYIKDILVFSSAFKKNHVIKGFNNVNVYQMICHVTGITPNPHNGTWSVVEDSFVKACKHCEL